MSGRSESDDDDLLAEFLEELTLSPEMGYGDRGAGNVIAPGATLLFEIELVELQSTAPAAAE